MSKKTTKTKPYDPGLLLTDDDLIADFLQEAMEDPDPAVFIVALGHAAKAKGIAKIATATGLGRTSLYKVGDHPENTQGTGRKTEAGRVAFR
jgi:probable addiction module antidote protein